MTASSTAEAADGPAVGRLATWRTVFNTANLPVGMTSPPDAISKWLVITRAAVFSMTVTSGLIGGLLASARCASTGEVTRRLGAARPRDRRARRRARGEQHDQRLLRPRGRHRHRRLRPRPLRAPPDPVGLGHEAPAGRGDPDRERDRPRDPARPHEPARARSSRRSRSAGLFVSVFYVAPPIRLKHIGLGEPGVFIVWGPLMVVGTFFVATGADPGLGVDRLAPLRDPRDDACCSGSTSTRSRPTRKKGVRTMPVLLGEARARRVAQALMVAYYPIVVGAVLVGWIGPWLFLVAARHPAPRRDAQGLRRAEAGGPAAQLRRLAAVVRRGGVRPHPAGRRPARPRPAPQRAAADPAALGLRHPGVSL